MVKLSLWLGAPSVITFFASSPGVRFEYALIVFVLSVLAMFVGIGPRLTGKNGH